MGRSQRSPGDGSSTRPASASGGPIARSRRRPRRRCSCSTPAPAGRPIGSCSSRRAYETADFAPPKGGGEPLTYVCDLAAIPVEDARFDRVVFNQVLEHVPDPPAVLRELARVLEDDGRIIGVTCPFFYQPSPPAVRTCYALYAPRLRGGCSRTPGSRSRSCRGVEGYVRDRRRSQFEQMHARPADTDARGTGSVRSGWSRPRPCCSCDSARSRWPGSSIVLDLRWKFVGKGSAEECTS